MRKNTRTIENIGTVSVKDLEICEGNIGLYIPIKTMSPQIREQLDKLEKRFIDNFKKNHPDVDTSGFTLNYDIALHMYLNTNSFAKEQENKVSYEVHYIIWFTDGENNELDVDFCDPVEIDINNEDSTYLKKLVITKLMDKFF